MNTGTVIRKLIGSECCKQVKCVEVELPRILIVGTPNVGKSLLFGKLTGKYVTVSNYPGTTVEISRGRSRILSGRYEVVDTPGMYSLSSITEEEKIARSLLETNPHAVLHVVDAKNADRMLGLTLQLIEAGLPVILVLNMADEARQLGIRFDVDRLEKLLGIPVVETVAITGRGLEKLTREISEIRPSRKEPIDYGPELEPWVVAIEKKLGKTPRISIRSRALLLLIEDPQETERLNHENGLERAGQILQMVSSARSELEHSVQYHVTLAVKAKVDEFLDQCQILPALEKVTLRERLSRVCMHPISGSLFLILVLYFGLYKFVGEFGAGAVVNFLEGIVFEDRINPWMKQIVTALIPWQSISDLFVGEFGIITLGLRYAVAIILPIVGTFFIAFSILEDSGYLPRLALLVDRLFKKIGLNGRAVIPMVLGFGCDTMATMVTRTLETTREKIIASILLALAIPCSAQLGVILGLLSGHPYAVVVWAGVVGLIFLTVGYLAARLLPGEGPSFYMELPPMRLPRLTNVLTKTYTRVVWYFKEILPLFVTASILIWVGTMTGVFQLMLRLLQPIMSLMGLPERAAFAFLFGFFRRDYGAAGLFDLHKQGMLSGNQLAVASISLTLFLPCIAQFLIMKKERGTKLTLLTSVGILVVAFTVGFIANALFRGLGVTL